MKLYKFQYLLGIMLVLFSCEERDITTDSSGFEVNMESDSIVFAVIGDYGLSGEPERRVADMVKSWNPDFILTAGDNNYYLGAWHTIKENVSKYYGDYIYNFDAPLKYQCQGKAFEDQANRFFPTPGNHDSKNMTWLEPYLSFFTLPGNELNYKFVWGPVTFYSINVLRPFAEIGRKWLEEQVATSRTPFRIVCFHYGPYSSGNHGNDVETQWDFHGLGIDVTFAGHDHIYERIEKIGEEGTYYIINGLGGFRKNGGCNSNPLSAEEFNCFCFEEEFGAIKAIATHNKLIIQFYAIGNPLAVDRVEIVK
ncbi:MAG: metallophosphoesterase [Bacteroidales bacterium]|nr:metallophosphoesterase [Bacteroidales bacterium]